MERIKRVKDKAPHIIKIKLKPKTTVEDEDEEIKEIMEEEVAEEVVVKEPASPPLKAVKEEISDDGVVFTALKMPHGIYLCTFISQTISEAQPSGFREVKKAFPSGLPQVRLNGYAAPVGMSPKCEVVNGFAITRDVPAKVWNLWFKQNHDSDLLAKELLFGARTYEEVVAFAKGVGKHLNGLEPIDPLGDIRMPGKATGRGKIETMTKEMV